MQAARSAASESLGELLNQLARLGLQLVLRGAEDLLQDGHDLGSELLHGRVLLVVWSLC